MTRILDIILSSAALVLFLPFGLVIALVLRLTGEGEVFYVQERVGKGGRHFGLIKFATMLKNSPSIGTGDVTVKGDPRVLPVGRFLRKTKLNEVPQLINILAGDMSVVGPRPQTPKNFDFFPPEGKQVILSMRPGLTGIGSIVFRDEESIVGRLGLSVESCYRQVIGPYKAELEAWYKERQNVVTYFLLIAVTAWVIIRPGSEIYRWMWPSLSPPPDALRPNTIPVAAFYHY
ncbi:MAG: sugar transferase [Treponema sp.]|jgi:lipopolysaccharide/colanic/teichoic acid biosynthesis glycosyltransferase|nr:sugar transferase [Treponema sp.]